MYENYIDLTVYWLSILLSMVHWSFLVFTDLFDVHILRDTGRKVEDPDMLERIRLTIINNLLKYHPVSLSSRFLPMGFLNDYFYIPKAWL